MGYISVSGKASAHQQLAGFSSSLKTGIRRLSTLHGCFLTLKEALPPGVLTSELSLLIFVCVFVFETRSYLVAQAILEFTVSSRLALNLQ